MRSHGGKYVYRRKGLLDETPHRRQTRGLIVVWAEDGDRAAGSLQEFEVKTRAHNVVTDPEHRFALVGKL